MLNFEGTKGCCPVIIDRRYQVQSSSRGEVTVFVFDRWRVSRYHAIDLPWQFSFTPEPGDVLAQVAQRLDQ